MDMNIQKYLAFVKTVEYSSFTKAAEVLHYSQSGISRMINDLEKEWKVILLERSKAGVKLTSDGLRLLPYAKSVCIEYKKLQMQVDELNGLQSGLIRIGTFSSVATHWLPKIIKEFQKDYPNIDYELLIGDYKEIEEWISEGRVDFGFLRLPTHPDFYTIFLSNKKSRLILVLKINRLCISNFSTFLNIATLNFATYLLIFLLFQRNLPLYVYLHSYDTPQLTIHNYSFSAF